MIEYQNDGRIARITFNRPDAGNRLTYAMMTDFIAALEDATKSGALVLFIGSIGADFTLGRDQKDKVDVSRRDNLSLILRANALLRNFPGVAVSLIRGRAMGFGSGLAIHSTIAIAEESAIFGFDEIRHGLAPLIVVAYLPYFIKPKVARELCLTGRDVPAREALELGLVSRIVADGALDAEAEALAQHLASLDAGAIRLIRSFSEESGQYPSDEVGKLGVEKLAAWLEAGKPEFPA